MKFFALLLCVAFFAAPAAVSGKSANNNEQHAKSTVSVPMVKPTVAPLMTSTVSPTKAAKISAAPTKAAVIKAAAKPNNGVKKTAGKSMSTPVDKKMEVKPTEKTPMAVEQDMMKMVVHPIDMPATVVPDKSVEMMEMTSSQMKAKEGKPLAVTGFITQNGNIYEIDDKDGIGKIEGRQSAPDDGKEHVCNYGTVVVYSDVPCEEIVTTEQVQPAPVVVDDKKEEMKPQEENSVADNQNKDTDKEKEDLDEMKPSRRPNSKKPRNKNKRRRQQLKNRRNKNRRVNRPGRRQSQNQRRSQEEQEYRQWRRRQQQKRRRAQLEEDEYRRQNQRRRNRGGNRRQPAYLDEYDDDY